MSDEPSLQADLETMWVTVTLAFDAPSEVHSALDRIEAKLKDLEHENREFRPYADALQARVQAAEAHLTESERGRIEAMEGQREQLQERMIFEARLAWLDGALSEIGYGSSVGTLHTAREIARTALATEEHLPNEGGANG